MNLTLLERGTIIAEYMPKEGHLADMKETRKARETLSYTGEEMTRFKIVQQGTGLAWPMTNEAQEYIVDLPLSEWIFTSIQVQLRNKEKDGKLKESELSLYEKFVADFDVLK
jgi:hypothetical protein